MNLVSEGLRLAGVVIAAGRAQRMGALKQTLPWPPHTADASTIVSCAFDAIAPFCAHMFVVVGRDAEAVLEALRERTFTREDADSDAEMFASIRAGLHAVIAQSNASDVNAVLLQPGDHPGVARSTVHAMIAAQRQHPGVAIMPEYRRRGGHPALIPHSLIPHLLAFAGAGGLRQFWLEHPDIVLRLPVDDPSSVIDLDTMDDYQAAWRSLHASCTKL